MEPKQYRKDHTSKIPHSTDRTTQNAIGVRVNVRHQSEIRPVAGFEEERHAGDEAKHGRFVLGVEEANGDEEGAGDDADEKDPGLFEPEVGGDVFVEEVADNAS
jgi:hypothetical protein